jgi:hypothetical protein
MKFTAAQEEKQQEEIEYMEGYGFDLTRGIFWWVEQENDPEYDPLSDNGFIIHMTPKDAYNKEGGQFDQHFSPEVFMSDEDGAKLGCPVEAVFVWEGTEQDFRDTMVKYKPFFKEFNFMEEDGPWR